MKITKVKFHAYRCFLESDWVALESDTTVLVGQNECGKSAFLLGLSYFDPEKQADSDGMLYPLRDYPLVADDYHAIRCKEKSASQIPVLTVEVTLESGEIDAFWNQLGLRIAEPITVTRHLDGGYRLQVGASGLAAAARSSAKDVLDTVKERASKFKEQYFEGRYTGEVVNIGSSGFGYIRSSEAPADRQSEERGLGNIYFRQEQVLGSAWQQLAQGDEVEFSLPKPPGPPSRAKMLPQAEQILKVHPIWEYIDNFIESDTEKIETLRDGADKLVQHLDEVPDQHPKRRAVDEFKRFLISARDMWDALSKAGHSAVAFEQTFLKEMPKFIYLGNLQFPEDEVALEELEQPVNGHAFFHHLLGIAGLTIMELKEKSLIELGDRLNEVSYTLTKRLSEFWPGPSFGLHLSSDGKSLRIDVNEEGGRRFRPSAKSDGFRWYLAVSAAILAHTGQPLTKLVIMIDDVDQHLHPSAQRKLLDAFRHLAERHQVLIATHSPYLIDRDSLRKVRVLQKEVYSGVSSTKQLEAGKEDIYEPIRTCLGMSWYEMLTAGGVIVLVEGRSDKIYLTAVNQVCQGLAMNHLSWSRFIILSAEGSSKMLPIYANLAAQSVPGGQGRNKILVVLDSDSDGRKRKRDLDQAGFGNRVIMLEEVVQTKKSESARSKMKIEIEDLFPPGLFQQVVRSVYPNIAAPRSKAIQRRGIINAYRESSGELDKVRIAEKFASEFAPKLAKEPWLENYDRLFAKMNRLGAIATE